MSVRRKKDGGRSYIPGRGDCIRRGARGGGGGSPSLPHCLSVVQHRQFTAYRATGWVRAAPRLANTRRRVALCHF